MNEVNWMAATVCLWAIGALHEFWMSGGFHDIDNKKYFEFSVVLILSLVWPFSALYRIMIWTAK